MKGSGLAYLCLCFRGLKIYIHFTLINLFVKDDKRDLGPGIGGQGLPDDAAWRDRASFASYFNKQMLQL